MRYLAGFRRRLSRGTTLSPSRIQYDGLRSEGKRVVDERNLTPDPTDPVEHWLSGMVMVKGIVRSSGEASGYPCKSLLTGATIHLSSLATRLICSSPATTLGPSPFKPLHRTRSLFSLSNLLDLLYLWRQPLPLLLQLPSCAHLRLFTLPRHPLPLLRPTIPILLPASQSVFPLSVILSASPLQRYPSSITPPASPLRPHPSSSTPFLIPTPRPRHRNAYSRSKVIICSVFFFFFSCSRSRVCLSLFRIVSTPSTRQRPHLRQSSDNVFSKRDRPQTSTFTSGRVERFRSGARIGGKGYFRDDAVARCSTL